jgi:hypothetical protein
LLDAVNRALTPVSCDQQHVLLWRYPGRVYRSASIRDYRAFPVRYLDSACHVQRWWRPVRGQVSRDDIVVRCSRNIDAWRFCGRWRALWQRECGTCDCRQAHFFVRRTGSIDFDERSSHIRTLPLWLDYRKRASYGNWRGSLRVNYRRSKYGRRAFWGEAGGDTGANARRRIVWVDGGR